MQHARSVSASNTIARQVLWAYHGARHTGARLACDLSDAAGHVNPTFEELVESRVAKRELAHVPWRTLKKIACSRGHHRYHAGCRGGRLRHPVAEDGGKRRPSASEREGDDAVAHTIASPRCRSSRLSIFSQPRARAPRARNRGIQQVRGSPDLRSRPAASQLLRGTNQPRSTHAKMQSQSSAGSAPCRLASR